MSTLTESNQKIPAVTRPVAKTERPHRRLALTRPTLPDNTSESDDALEATTPPSLTPQESLTQAEGFATPVSPSSENKARPVPKSAATPRTKVKKTISIPSVPEDASPDSASSTVRVMAYLSDTEAGQLDDLWIQHRRLPQKPSKSDILRAALSLAARQGDELTAILSQQQNNTLSRQRDSKAKRALS